jgi:beta-lactamase class A
MRSACATPIPANLRQLIAYDAGFADWQTITWDHLTSGSPDGSPHPILNDVITMASTPDDLVSFFSRALQGEFFQYEETLGVFRAILSTADAIARTMPLGVSAFGKGGSFDLNQEYALSFAGGVYVPDRWVYFSLIIN